MAKKSDCGHFKTNALIKTPTTGLADSKGARKRRRSKAPKLLDKVIQLANLPEQRLRPLVPLDTEFPPPPPGDWPRDFSFRAWAGKQDRATLQSWLDQRLEGFQEKFKDYVTNDQGRSHVLWFFSAVYRYERVRDAQRKLRAIIQAVREAEETGRLPISIYIETHNAAFIDESWILRKESDEFDTAVFGSDQKIDARMIRQCEICNRFFFARRIDSKVCDPDSKCAVTLSKRRERANAKLRAELATKKKRAKTARKR